MLKGAEEGQVVDEGDPELRSVAGPSDDATAASALNKGRFVTDDMRRTLNEQFQPQGVMVSDVIITDVQLPSTIVNQMAEKTSVIAQNAITEVFSAI